MFIWHCDAIHWAQEPADWELPAGLAARAGLRWKVTMLLLLSCTLASTGYTQTHPRISKQKKQTDVVETGAQSDN